MKPFKLARAGIVAIICLMLFVVFTGKSEAQNENVKWERTDAMLQKAPDAPNFDYLRVQTQAVSPNLWRATVNSANSGQTQILLIQTQTSGQNRFKAEPDSWAEMARRANSNSNFDIVEVIPLYVPNAEDPGLLLTEETRKPPQRYGRTLAEMQKRE